MIRIRPCENGDWDGVWAILEPVFRAGETYAVRRDIDEADARDFWIAAPHQAFVAIDESTGAVLGTYFLKPNSAGPGAHVCNCGYVVAEEARGRGVATNLCVHSQDEAIARGYRAMQFNLVVATNLAAIRLWRRLGFDIVGTLPSAFQHPEHGYVDAHIMYKNLRAANS